MDEQLREVAACDGLQSVLFGIVVALVDEPADVHVAGNEVDGIVTLLVTVAPGDIGKVIGKQGRTARSLRTILGAAGVKAGVRCQLDISDHAERDGGL